MFRALFLVILTCLVTASLAQETGIDSLVTWQPDSLYASQLEQLDSIKQQTSEVLTSLHHQYDSTNQAFSSKLETLNHKKDSLTRLNLPTTSIQQQIDSVEQARLQKLTDLKSRADEVKQNCLDKVNSLQLPSEVGDKVKEYTASLNKVDISLPGSDFTVPSLSIPNLDNLTMPDLQNLPNADLSGLEKLPVGSEVKGLTGDIKNIQGDIPTDITNPDQLIENKVADLAEVKAFDGLPEAPGMNAENPQDMAKEEIKKAAVDHFAGKQEQLKAAMDKMSKYKQQYASVQSIKDLPKKPPNPLKEKPFIERVVEGVALQVFKKDDWLLDVSPYLGYRFNPRLTLGAGWNHRIAFGEQNKHTTSVYGPRVYGEYRAFKGFSARLELETMNTYVFTNPQQPENGGREWVPAVLAGMKKEYKIYKRLKGTALVLYNFYNPQYKSPYGDRLNIRFGFEYSIKEKKVSH
jgi:hypothetical protein